MNLLASIGVLLLDIFPGVLIVHFMWDDEEITALVFKLFLGIGVGLGITSFLYFLYLLLFAGQHIFLYIQIGILLFLLLVAKSRRKLKYHLSLPGFQWKYWQVGLLITVFVMIVFSFLGALTVWMHRPYGTVDAYMIYNRTARFIYRDPSNWTQSFSKQINPALQANYPLLIPLNVASGWDDIGHETNYVPLVFSGFFIFACAGLFVSAIALTKSIWQAGVGLVILLNTTFFIMNGASQTADVPLAFFIFSTVALVCLYVFRQNPCLLILAGLTSGLAGWTKNEGELFIIAIFAALFISFIKRYPWRTLGLYLTGLIIPLAFILYFKLFLAPPTDVLSNGVSHSIQQILEWPRHITIFNAFKAGILGFGQSEFGILPVLLIYALIFGFTPKKSLQPAYLTILLMLVFQMAGYYIIYLITPNPLDWQLTFSLERLLLQIYLPFLFLFFVLVTDIQVILNYKDRLKQPESTA
jgi:hypothetical protein